MPHSGKGEFRCRLTWRAAQGTRRAASLGRLLFGYFLLAKQEKVTSRRATPGDVAVLGISRGETDDGDTVFIWVDAIIPHPQVSSTVKSIPRDQIWCATPVAAGALRPWLTDRGSLTARLQRYAGPITVQVLFQGLRRVNRDETFLFALSAHVLVREVLLLCGHTPLVFAHTVLARDGLRGAWRSIARLGTRPLGAALFADPRVTRFPLRQKKLPRSHALHRQAVGQLQCPLPPLWARRSIFAVGKSPILVSEVFLPAILNL